MTPEVLKIMGGCKYHFESITDLNSNTADMNQEGMGNICSLFQHVREGNVELVTQTLNRVNVNAKDENGITALMYAARVGNFEIVDLLLMKGADVNAQDNNGITALMQAAYAGKIDIFDLLLSNDANYQLKDRLGRSLWMFVIMGGEQIFNRLIKFASCPVNQSTNQGHTMLMYAAYHGQIGISGYLLDNGADVGSIIYNSKRAFDFSKRSHHQAFLDLVRKKRGSDIVDQYTRDSDPNVFWKYDDSTVTLEDWKNITCTYPRRHGPIPVEEFLLPAWDIKPMTEEERKASHRAVYENEANMPQYDHVRHGGHGLVLDVRCESAKDLVSTILETFANSKQSGIKVEHNVYISTIEVKFVESDWVEICMYKVPYYKKLYRLTLREQKSRNSFGGNHEVVRDILNKAFSKNVTASSDHDNNKASASASASAATSASMVDVSDLRMTMDQNLTISGGPNLREQSVAALSAMNKVSRIKKIPGVSDNGFFCDKLIPRSMLGSLRDQSSKKSIAADVSRCADMAEKSNQVTTDLMRAAEEGNFQFVASYIYNGYNGEDIEAQDQNGNTALMLAAQNGHKDVVTSLLSSSAKVFSKNKNNETAISLAAKNRYAGVVDVIVKSLDRQYTVDDVTFNYPMVDAVINDDTETVRAILPIYLDKRATAFSFKYMDSIFDNKKNTNSTPEPFGDRLIFRQSSDRQLSKETIVSRSTVAARIISAIPGHLVTLDLSSNKLGYLCANDLETLLKATPEHITSLDLSDNDLKVLGSDGLAKVIESIPKTVKSLSLNHNDLSDNLQTVFGSIPEGVTTLVLKCLSEMDTISAENLSAAFPAIPKNVTSLVLTNIRFDSMVPNLKLIPDWVTTLDLSNADFRKELCAIGMRKMGYATDEKEDSNSIPTMIGKFLELLPNHKILLQLNHNYLNINHVLNADNLNYLRSFLEKIPPQVTSLELRNNRIDIMEIKEDRYIAIAGIIEAIPPHLKSLDFRGNKLFSSKSPDEEKWIEDFFRSSGKSCDIMIERGWFTERTVTLFKQTRKLETVRLFSEATIGQDTSKDHNKEARKNNLNA